ncbi:MAG: hypothetical protein ACM3SX_16260 [Deltaproteobacteria bacterium]
MRTSIVLWSTISGAVLGIFIDATLIGVALLLSAVPGLGARLNHRWLATTAAVGLLVIFVAMTVLGYLEGQLKAT